jgi:ribose/xylose/arabinose/galactoside ABC-type transport system permease subunit
VAFLNVPPFVATLGVLGVVRGAALIATAGQSIALNDVFLTGLATGRVGPIPIPFVIALLVFAMAYTVMERTAFGRHVLAVGGSKEAAVDSGINVRRVTLLAYIVAAVCASLGGILMVSQLGNATGTLGTGLELQIIAITVLGGTSLTGGTGNLLGTFVAAILLTIINAALNLLNVPSFYQYLAVGLLLLLALGADSLRRSLQRAALMGV